LYQEHEDEQDMMTHHRQNQCNECQWDWIEVLVVDHTFVIVICKPHIIDGELQEIGLVDSFFILEVLNGE
jgi:hypothetical protein